MDEWVNDDGTIGRAMTPEPPKLSLKLRACRHAVIFSFLYRASIFPLPACPLHTSLFTLPPSTLLFSSTASFLFVFVFFFGLLPQSLLPLNLGTYIYTPSVDQLTLFAASIAGHMTLPFTLITFTHFGIR